MAMLLPLVVWIVSGKSLGRYRLSNVLVWWWWLVQFLVYPLELYSGGPVLGGCQYRCCYRHQVGRRQHCGE